LTAPREQKNVNGKSAVEILSSKKK